MIIIINGPLGIGKSSTSWELLSKFNKAIMLDGDYIGAVHPFEIYDKDRTRYLYRTLEHLISFHRANGYEHFVINYVFEEIPELDELIKYLNPFQIPIHCFRLTCSEATHINRIKERNHEDLAYEINRGLELADIQNKNAMGNQLGHVIDTTNLNRKQVAKLIVDNIQK